jgi:thiamine pyrophosphokinase
VENVTLRSDFPLGVSNEFVGKEAEITVKNGDLLLVFDKNNLEKFLKNVKEM